MRNTITRTITVTIVKSSNVLFKDGAPVVTPNADLTINGKVTEAKALKQIQKKYGATSLITSIENVDDTYEISVDDFMKHATKLEPVTKK